MRWILLLTLTSCATYTTKHGIQVYDDTKSITQSEFEEVTEFAMDRLSINPNQLEGVKVYLIPNKWIVQQNPDGTITLADGYTHIGDGVVLISVFQTCLADSSLVHELDHIGYEVPHNELYVERFEKHVKLVEKQAIQDLCPSGYEHKEVKPPERISF